MSLPSELLPVGLLGTGAVAAEAEAEGYTIERSVRFNSSDSAYLSRTPSTAGNRKTWTWAGWVKRVRLSTSQETLFMGGSTSSDTGSMLMGFTSSDVFFVGGYLTNFVITTQVFRDTSAWYHFVVALDTTQGTATNTLKIYVNGSQITTFGTDNRATKTSSSVDLGINQAVEHRINVQTTGGYYGNHYLADIHFIDGQALDPTSFGEFDDNGIWQPIAYTGNYGLVSVADATGALPIYNTTDTLGAVKGTGTRTDSNSSSIVLAIPMDGANNGTTFTDESATIKGSGSAKGITRNGDTKTSTAQSKYYGSSGYFDGTGDTLTLAASSDFAFGTNDFTIETWIYSEDISGSTQKGFFQLSDSSGGLNTDLNTGVAIYFGSGGYLTFKTGGITVISSLALSQNTWYHIAVTRSGDVHRLFVDGIQRGSVTSSRSDITQQNVVVGGIYSTSYLYQGYLNDFRVYKGVAKYTSNFTIVTTNNSFHLPFSDNSTAAALGTDTSGNSNTWTVNNISVAAGAGNDSLVDVPTNGTETDTGIGGEVRGNYATLNPLDNGGLTLSNGNLNASRATSSWVSCRSTIGLTSGKWYWEISGTGTYDASNGPLIGISKTSATLSTYPGGDANGWGYYSANGQKYTSGSGSAYGSSWTGSDVIGVAFDADNGTLTFYKNNSSQGTAFTGLTSGPYFPAVGIYGTATVYINFGQRPFTYTAPSGFKALCTANLPAPVVTKPSDYFDILLWTGDGSASRSISLPIAGDLVWAKKRSASASHQIADTVRGDSAVLLANRDNAEANPAGFTGGGISSITATEFVISQGTSDNNNLNLLNGTHVAWTWDAGSSTVTNTDGSISSQVRANASAGFSIVTFTKTANTNETIGHGLNVAPSMVIVKTRQSSGYTGWAVYHISTGSNNYLELNTTSAFNTNSTTWNNTAPTSSVFSMGTGWTSTQNMVAYCFAPVESYSAFGSYTGNGSATDGPFVFTNHRPRWILLKRTDTTSNWTIIDTAREGYNVDNDPLYPNLNSAEGTTDLADILSNGFKLRSTDASVNASAGTYIYASFAEQPFQYSRAR